MILSMKKLSDWVLEQAKEGEDHPEVIRFAKELLIQAEFGAFEPDEEDINGVEEEF
ncbi:hypothetical protein [Paenibacillus macerans]|uniref:hypothetical protein n=1 Tax=Paenibacillus macerans TaxID=44252 RepID=UPI00204263CB|nr:hypothetical protein [Paenibacillus macerans]MCM3703820.1 hypothetical protein [Paenibacillus macerans]